MGKIGVVIKQQREQKGIKQGELAKAAKISQSQLSKIESGFGAPPFETIKKIAEYLQVPIEKFYTDNIQISTQNVHDQAHGVYIESENNSFKLQIEELKKLLIQKDDLLGEYKNIIQQLNNKIARRDSKISDLKNSKINPDDFSKFNLL